MAAQRMKPILYGAAYSVYVRIARLALIEKAVDHERVEIDIFADGGPPADYLSRHPFARLPAFQHGDVAVYETGAITRYVEEAFPGPRLMPEDPARRARVNQLVSVLDNYLYRPLVWDIHVARDAAVKSGNAADETAIAAAVAKVRHCLGVLESGAGDWLAGDALTLADLYAAPMIAYGVMTDEGRALLQERPRLAAWWQRMSARPSLAATRYPTD
ncbi:MAG: glutathione S-transferase family protein [Rhodospirillaceae bacterium]|nr:glutathione S-transferase family protein [Rhodospirillaceae bacterium]